MQRSSHAAGLIRPLVLGLSLLAGCSGAGRAALPCAADAECPSAARCTGGACVANAPPVAAFHAPAVAEAHALVTLDGAASSDPDGARDAVVSFAWSVTAVDAPCEPPVVAGTGPQALVRFACPGRHAVQLVVTDSLGAQSAPYRKEVEVRPSTGAPLLTTGPDVAVGHRCKGAPLRCTPDAKVSLLAEATPGGFGPVTLSWSVIPPPDRPLGEDRRVTLSPGPEDPAPEVLLETDGTAISGDWLFQVEARDDAGVLGVGTVRVSVGNRPPIISANDPQPVDHAFLPADSSFVASGAIAVTVVDPDGDPVPVRTALWRHTGDGEGTFDGEYAGSQLTFAIRVPYGVPGDARHLIGGAGLERAVELTVQDVNGAETRRAFPVRVGNRPPVESAPAPFGAADHSYDPTMKRYRASFVMTPWTDPDGDPLQQLGDTGDLDCPALATLGDGRVVVECSRPFTGSVGDLFPFVATRVVKPAIGDPWSAGTAAYDYTLTVRNRAPTVTSSTDAVTVSCPPDPTSDVCCHYVGMKCVSWGRAVPSVTYGFVPQVADADGDPLEIRVSDGSRPTEVCVPGQCGRIVRTLPDAVVCGAAPGETVTFTASDGLATATATHTITRTCL